MLVLYYLIIKCVMLCDYIEVSHNRINSKTATDVTPGDTSVHHGSGCSFKTDSSVVIVGLSSKCVTSIILGVDEKGKSCYFL